MILEKEVLGFPGINYYLKDIMMSKNGSVLYRSPGPGIVHYSY